MMNVSSVQTKNKIYYSYDKQRKETSNNCLNTHSLLKICILPEYPALTRNNTLSTSNESVSIIIYGFEISELSVLEIRNK